MNERSFTPPRERVRAKPRAPKKGRKPGNFGTHPRLTKLREALERQPSGLTLEVLAAALGVTTRSVRRYLMELARFVDLESIETEPGGAHLWRIKPSERGRALNLRRTQAYALLATRRHFEALKGSALYDEIDLVMRQLVMLAQRPGRTATRGEIAANARLEDRLLFLPDAPRRYESRAEELDSLFHAVADLRTVTARVEDETAGTLHPYALLLHRGVIWCVAHSPYLKETRAMSFDRMHEVRVTSDRFSLPESFDVSEWWQGDFGIGAPVRTREKIRALVEFEARLASEVRSRKAHPSQRTAVAPDGRVRVSLTLGDLQMATRWVLGFGDGARAIEPPELVRAVESSLRKSLVKYI